MTVTDDGLVLDDQGQLIGQAAVAEDGVTVVIGLDGRIAMAVAPDGSQVDPNGYETFDDGAQPAEPASLEAAAEQAGLEALGSDLQSQMQSLTKRLGHSLTDSEIERLSHVATAHIDAGREVDLVQAVQQLAEEGRGLHDRDSRQGRVSAIRERIADSEREQNPIVAREYDVDDRAQRLEYMTARVTGTLHEDSKAVHGAERDE